jgi:2,5-dihydroxypyridine 5,6-dioxygenase
MDLAMSSADLVALFEAELQLCRVRAGENVLLFTDPRFPHPVYPPAAFAAARCLGANVYLLTSQGDQQLDDPLVRAAWQHADMILGMSTLPRGIGSWMYTETHDAALSMGARVLMVQEPLDVLRRMLPNEAVRRRGVRGAQRLQEAKELHIVSDAGSDYTLRKDGRPAMYQCGIADEPGRWDHWPSGLVAIGRNTFRAPADYSGFGGQNVSELHFDICCRNTDLYLDGELIIHNEGFVAEGLG